MTTANEVLLKQQAFMPRVVTMQEILRTYHSELTDVFIQIAIGREVCARRARKIRKRGDNVKFSKTTITGKARYTWVKNMPVKFTW